MFEVGRPPACLSRSGCSLGELQGVRPDKFCQAEHPEDLFPIQSNPLDRIWNSVHDTVADGLKLRIAGQICCSHLTKVRQGNAWGYEILKLENLQHRRLTTHSCNGLCFRLTTVGNINPEWLVQRPRSSSSTTPLGTGERNMSTFWWFAVIVSQCDTWLRYLSDPQ